MTSSVVEAGRRGGQARARNLSPERRREIARQGWIGRAAKRISGVSKRECVGRIVRRIREYREPVLATFIGLALRRSEPMASGLIDLLNERAFRIVEAAIVEVVEELPEPGACLTAGKQGGQS